MLWLVSTQLPMLLAMALWQGPAEEPPEIQRPEALEKARKEEAQEKQTEDDEEKRAEDEEPAQAPGQPAPRPETPFEAGQKPETPLEQQPTPKVEPTPPPPTPRPKAPMPEPWEPEPDEEAKAAWRRAHRGFRGRFGFAASLSGYAFIPPPPAVAGGLGLFAGAKLVPKFRGKKMLRNRSLGYWGQVNVTAAPFSILHRHMFAISGSGGPRTSIFYEVGGGFVHYGCCGSDLPGGTVGAFAGWRIPAGDSERAFVLGLPLMIDMLVDADVRGSIGLGVALTNI
jgi:hypothetical protein